MTTRTQQARFINKTLVNGARKFKAGDVAGGLSSVRAYAMTLGVITLFSGENAIHREMEEALNAASPGFGAEVKEQMDKVAFVGKALHTDVSHMQPSFIPMLWSGQTMVGSGVKQIKQSMEGGEKLARGRGEESDVRHVQRGVAMISALAGVASLFGGKIGMEAGVKLLSRVSEGAKGERMLWAFPKNSVVDAFESAKKPLASKTSKTNMAASVYDWAMAGETPELGHFINEQRRQDAAGRYMKRWFPEQYEAIDELYNETERETFGEMRGIEAESRKAGKPLRILPAQPMIKRDWLRMLDNAIEGQHPPEPKKAPSGFLPTSASGET
jgi:hypothetical protein